MQLCRIGECAAAWTSVVERCTCSVCPIYIFSGGLAVPPILTYRKNDSETENHDNTVKLGGCTRELLPGLVLVAL